MLVGTLSSGSQNINCFQSMSQNQIDIFLFSKSKLSMTRTSGQLTPKKWKSKYSEKFLLSVNYWPSMASKQPDGGWLKRWVQRSFNYLKLRWVVFGKFGFLMTYFVMIHNSICQIWRFLQYFPYILLEPIIWQVQSEFV